MSAPGTESSTTGPETNKPQQIDQDLFGFLDDITTQNKAAIGLMDYARLTGDEIKGEVEKRLHDPKEQTVLIARELATRLQPPTDDTTQVELSRQEAELLGITIGDGESTISGTPRKILARAVNHVTHLANPASGDCVFRSGTTIADGERRQNGVNGLVATRAVLGEVALQATQAGDLASAAYWLAQAASFDTKAPDWSQKPWVEAVQKISAGTEDRGQLKAVIALEQQLAHLANVASLAEHVPDIRQRVDAAKQTEAALQERERKRLRTEAHEARLKTLDDDIYESTSEAAQHAFDALARTEGVTFEETREVSIGDGGRSETIPLQMLLSDKEFVSMLRIPEVIRQPQGLGDEWLISNIRDLPTPMANLAVLRNMKTNPDMLNRAVTVLSTRLNTDWTGYGREDYPDQSAWEGSLRNLLLQSVDGYALGILRASSAYEGKWLNDRQSPLVCERNIDATVQAALEVLFGGLNPAGTDAEKAQIQDNPAMRQALIRMRPLFTGEKGPFYQAYLTLDKAIQRKDREVKRQQRLADLKAQEAQEHLREQEALEAARKSKIGDVERMIAPKLVDAQGQLDELRQISEFIKAAREFGPRMAQMPQKDLDRYIELVWVQTRDLTTLGKKDDHTQPRMRLTAHALDMIRGTPIERAKALLAQLEGKGDSASRKDREDIQRLRTELARMPAVQAFWQEVQRRIDQSYGVNHTSSRIQKSPFGGAKTIHRMEQGRFDPSAMSRATNRSRVDIHESEVDQIDGAIQQHRSTLQAVQADKQSLIGEITAVKSRDELNRELSQRITRLSDRINALEIARHKNTAKARSEDYIRLCVDDFLMGPVQRLVQQQDLFK